MNDQERIARLRALARRLDLRGDAAARDLAIDVRNRIAAIELGGDLDVDRSETNLLLAAMER